MKLTGLWLHSEFRKLWGGQTVSLFGSQIMFLALPLTAVTVLDASPIQMGIVTAMTGAPAVFGIWLGAWSDRRKRLPIIIASDAGRALLLAIVPVAYIFDFLSMGIIYFVAFGVGAMSMLFQIAYRSFLPSVVRQGQLVEANSKLEFATSGAGSVGPAITGLLIQWLTAPFTLFFGTGLFGLSGLLFGRIRVNERDPRQDEGSSGGIREGLDFFRRNGLLIGIAGSQSHAVMFGSAFEAISLLYMVNKLGLNEGTIGLIIGGASIGLFGGAWLSSRYASKVGVGRATAIGLTAIGIGDLMLPIVDGPLVLIIPVLIVGGMVTEAGFVSYNIGQVSIKQAITPDPLQGRVTSILVVLSRAAVPVGGLLGGFMGEIIGLRTTLFIAAGGMATAGVWLLAFRVIGVTRLDDETAMPTGPGGN